MWYAENLGFSKTPGEVILQTAIAAKFIWHNGRIVPWTIATVHVSCHALHYGSGVFEAIRCYDTRQGPAVFRLDEHIDRFLSSAQCYRLARPYAREELHRAVLELIESNGFTDCYVPPLGFSGSHSLSLYPEACPVDVIILAWSWVDFLRPDAREQGSSVSAPWRKLPSQAFPPTAKASGQFLNSLLATEDARVRGFDEALLLNLDGTIAGGASENLFLVRDGRLMTNDEQSSILPGITRNSVLYLAAGLGIPTHVGKMQPADLLSADEAFFTGTSIETAPITRINNCRIGAGALGSISSVLREAYANIVRGRDASAGDWLTFTSAKQPVIKKGEALTP